MIFVLFKCYLYKADGKTSWQYFKLIWFNGQREKLQAEHLNIKTFKV